MSEKSKLVKRLQGLMPTALADQVTEEVIDSLWLAEHDAEVRAGVVAAEPKDAETHVCCGYQWIDTAEGATTDRENGSES